jgi:hypothetical protein
VYRGVTAAGCVGDETLSHSIALPSSFFLLLLLLLLRLPSLPSPLFSVCDAYHGSRGGGEGGGVPMG